jgi:hypothetical protein
MDFWTNLWSFATAVGTIALAAATYAIIRQGKTLREDAKNQRQDLERQHQERSKPVCVLMPWNGIDPFTMRNTLLDVVGVDPSNSSIGLLGINCFLRNVGVGPALKLKIRLGSPVVARYPGDEWEYAPLAAGESRGEEDKPLYLPLKFGDSFNQTDFVMVTGTPWEIVLCYEDVFGNKFRSVHSKSSFDMRPETFTWTNPPVGGQPKAIMRAIPWLTYVEIKNP